MAGETRVCAKVGVGGWMSHFFLEETAVLTVAWSGLHALWHSGSGFPSLPPTYRYPTLAIGWREGIPEVCSEQLYTWTLTAGRKVFRPGQNLP